MNRRIVPLFTLLVFLFLSSSQQLWACDESSVDLVGCINDNGTYTYTLDICLEYTGLEGPPDAFSITMMGVMNIDAFTPPSIMTSSGDVYTGTVSGNVLTYFTMSTFIAHNNNILCEQYTITTSEPATSILVDVHQGYPDPECRHTIAINNLVLQPKVFLQGPLNMGMMDDDLRAAGLIPINEPYGTGNGEMLNPSLLVNTGNDAIVDWVEVQLRDPMTPTMIIAKRAALVQRDGDVVDTDGASGVKFIGVSAGNYHVAIRHRNHLSIMTDTPVMIN